MQSGKERGEREKKDYVTFGFYFGNFGDEQQEKKHHLHRTVKEA